MYHRHATTCNPTLISSSCETIDKQKDYIKNLKQEMPGNRELFERIYKFAFTISLS
jgi:hypothetical protein